MKRAFETALLFSLSPLVVAHAQSPATDIQNTPSSSPAAPIVRSYPGQSFGQNLGQDRAVGTRIFDLQPNAGVFVRSDAGNGVETVTATSALTELRIVHGRADVTVHHPANHSQILVDLPGGQVSLFKDGLYTFNAATNTVRVLHGEAEAYLDAKDNFKGTKVKETQQLSFFNKEKLKSVNAYPYELTADLLPGSDRSRGDGPPRNGYYGEGNEGGYPFYASGYSYPYGYGFYPYGYGYGYPFGVGLGFGYYGGYRGGFGGFRGGFRR